MSGKREKAVRRALRMYEGVVQDVDKLKCRVGRVEMRQEDYVTLAGVNIRAIRKEMRRESRKRRKADRMGAWALGLAVVEGLGLAALAAVVLL